MVQPSASKQPRAVGSPSRHEVEDVLDPHCSWPFPEQPCAMHVETKPIASVRASIRFRARIQDGCFIVICES